MEFYTNEKVTEHITRIRAFWDDACMYFIRGEKSGILVDTGYGFGHLRAYVDELADGLPYEVVLSHGHIDHANGSGEWDKVWMSHLDIDLYHTRSAIPERKKFLKKYVPDIDTYPDDMFPPVHSDDFIDLKDGQVFDLGNLTVETIWAPGHTHGMMVFLVKEDRTILFGDACGVFTLFVHPEATSLEEFQNTLAVLKSHESEYDRILRQHGTCESPKSLLDEDIHLVQLVLAGKDDHFPMEFNGIKAFAAKAFNDKAQRLDGKEGNIIYTPAKIYKAGGSYENQ